MIHATIDLSCDAEGWWVARCECGWNGGEFPDAETAADALMDHAYTEGVRDAAERAAQR